jgi:hypothetical protein
VDDNGRIVREVKVASKLEALLQVLTNPAPILDNDVGGGIGVRLAAPVSTRP